MRGVYTVGFSFHSVITAGFHEEYQKNTEQYRELQKKVKHFQLTDTKQFHDIWHMDEDRARSLAREVLNADETIYRQQLGLEWQPPQPVESPMKAAAIEREASQATLYASQILSEAGSEPGSLAEGSMASAAYPLSLIRQVLELLCEESGFLQGTLSKPEDHWFTAA